MWHLRTHQLSPFLLFFFWSVYGHELEPPVKHAFFVQKHFQLTWTRLHLNSCIHLYLCVDFVCNRAATKTPFACRLDKPWGKKESGELLPVFSLGATSHAIHCNFCVLCINIYILGVFPMLLSKVRATMEWASFLRELKVHRINVPFSMEEPGYRSE